MSILGASNPAPGVGKGIVYMGDGIWAGWSGQIIVNNATVEMFNFTTPNQGLIVTNFQYYIEHSEASPSSAEYVGWILTIDDIVVIKNILKATILQHYNDFDPNSFILPANSTVQIESFTNADVPIPTYAVMTIKQIE